MALNTALGYQFLLYTLARGGTAFFTGKSFEDTAEAFEDYGVECWVASPAGLANLLKGYEEYPTYQSRLRLVISAGDQLASQLADRVRARLCSHVVSLYGSSEAGITATAPVHAIDHLRGAAGFITPDVSLQVVDSRGKMLPPDVEGAVRIRAAFAVKEYFANPEESAKVFRDAWFYPGDIGAVTADNVLLLAGREKNILNIGGDKINPEEIEQVLCAFPEVEQAVAFGMPNDMGNEVVWAAIVARGAIDQAKLDAYCRSRLSRQFVPVGFEFVEQIPRNQMGKIDRRALSDRLKPSAAANAL
jgi:acyl-coenzyme A synthetase/AMP-(fatty) acid ligase